MSKTAKIISGILGAILITVVLYASIPSVWFWIGFEVLAAVLVSAGCSGEWYLHHHPAGRKKKEKDEHHRLESRFIAAVVLGVVMEFFALAHAIPAAIQLEKDVALANDRAGQADERASIAQKEAGEANERAAKFDADRELIARQAEEIRSTNLVLQTELAELQARMTPRTIADLDREKFLKLLSDAPKGHVEVEISFGSGNEISSYAEQIRKMIGAAGYDVGGMCGMRGGVLPKGVFIGVKNSTNQPPFAGPIQQALNAIGILANGFSAKNERPLKEDTLLILVGEKP